MSSAPTSTGPTAGRFSPGPTAGKFSPGPTAGKYHGLGNDFVVVLDPAAELAIDADVARRICDRHRGIGADGLILGRPSAPGAPSAPGGHEAAVGFQLWNADGSGAEMSGNGVRCLAHAALEAGWVAHGEPFSVQTVAGTREVSIRRTGPDETWGSVGMGTARICGDDQRCNVGHGQLEVDMGNPHLVVLGPDPATLDVGQLGQALGTATPEGRNVEFVTLGPGPDEVTMRVWERGVGETLACGTGSCAAAVALHHWGRVGPEVTVHQPGGSVAVSIGPDDEVTLSGPSRRVVDLDLAALAADVAAGMWP